MSAYDKDLKKHDMLNFGVYLAHGLNEKKKAEGIEQTFHGLVGPDEANIFNLNHCETDRFWRAMWQITPERYQRFDIPQFDECRNAYQKPKPPRSISILDSLYKKEAFMGPPVQAEAAEGGDEE